MTPKSNAITRSESRAFELGNCDMTVSAHRTDGGVIETPLDLDHIMDTFVYGAEAQLAELGEFLPGLDLETGNVVYGESRSMTAGSVTLDLEVTFTLGVQAPLHRLVEQVQCLLDYAQRCAVHTLAPSPSRVTVITGTGLESLLDVLTGALGSDDMTV